MKRVHHRFMAVLLFVGIVFSMVSGFTFEIYGAAPDKPEAENLQVKGTLKPGYTLTAVYDYVYAVSEGASEYKWLDCSTANGTYTEIAGATDKSLTIKNAQQNKYIKFQVAPQSRDGARGESVQSAAAGPVAAPLGPVNILTAAYSDAVQDTPADYLFNIQGSNSIFSLLDTTEDNDSKFFVMGIYASGSQRYASSLFDLDNKARFDPNNDRNIGYYLNRMVTDTSQPKWAGLSGSTDNRLPAQLVPYIDTHHEWLTEAGDPNSNCPDDYVTVCGVNLLAMHEYARYHNKVGYEDNITNGNWWLRTSRGIGNANKTNQMLVVQYADGKTNIKDSNISAANGVVRPVFYLNRNFITSLKLDVNNMGAEVKKAIIKNYHISEVRALYTDQELIKIGYVNLPQAQNVSVKGGKAAGETVYGDYTYFSPDHKDENNSAFKWLSCDTENGNYVPIPGAVSKTYAIDPAYNGKYIKFEVTPTNVAGLAGEFTRSPAIGPLRQVQDISVVLEQFTDKDGGNFTDLQSASSISVNMNITNRTSAQKQVIVMIALYDAHNTLLKAELNPISVHTGTKHYSSAMDLDGQGYILRAVVLDGVDSMRPLSMVKETR